MARNTRLSEEAQNVQLDALAPLADDGYIRLYDGEQPATPNTAVTTQTLLAELRLGNPAFGAAVGGIITANPIADDSDANATGTVSWFRVLKSDGVSPLWDGSVGVANADGIVNSVSIQQHARVKIDVFTHDLPMQGS